MNSSIEASADTTLFNSITGLEIKNSPFIPQKMPKDEAEKAARKAEKAKKRAEAATSAANANGGSMSDVEMAMGDVSMVDGEGKVNKNDLYFCLGI